MGYYTTGRGAHYASETMVNKPIGLYLYDERNRENAEHRQAELTVSPVCSSPCHGTLRPVTLVSASRTHPSGPSSADASTARSVEILTALVNARRRGTHRSVVDDASVTLVPAQSVRHGTDSPELASTLSSQSPQQAVPEVLYAHLDTGFFFECYVSHHGK